MALVSRASSISRKMFPNNGKVSFYEMFSPQISTEGLKMSNKKHGVLHAVFFD